MLPSGILHRGSATAANKVLDSPPSLQQLFRTAPLSLQQLPASQLCPLRVPLANGAPAIFITFTDRRRYSQCLARCQVTDKRNRTLAPSGYEVIQAL